MTGKHDTWLRELARSGKGGVRVAAARRGLRWKLSVTLPGDWTGATVRGEVRASPDGPALDPAMEFDCVNEGYADGETVFNVYLFAGTGAQGTGSLPADDDADGVEEFPFELLLTPDGGVEELLIGGVLPVTGRIPE